MEAGAAAFARATGLFQSLVGDLADCKADAMTVFELEVMVGERGREVMLELLQGHMDLRSIREPQLNEVVDADGVAHRRIEKNHERQLNTVFGKLRIRRIAYRALGCANLHPLDAALSLPVERASHGVRRLAAIEATRGSFADARAAIERACGLRVGKLVVEQLALRAAVDIDRFYRRTDPARAEPEVPLALSFDARGIVMIPRDLHEDTRKAAEAKAAEGGRAMKTRLASGEKNGRKRMAVARRGLGRPGRAPRHR